jgi:hypothetical protein
MKHLIFLSVLLFTFCSFYTAVAQDTEGLKIIELNKDDPDFVIPRLIELYPGQSFQFKAIDGDFNILIRGADDIIQDMDGDLDIRINSSTTPLSKIYLVKKRVRDDVKTFQVYCITINGWPDAPPRIIIVTQ